MSAGGSDVVVPDVVPPPEPSGEPASHVRIDVLGTGSRGNASIISWSHDGRTRAFMVDAGFSPRETARRLAATGLGLELADLEGAVITHPDRDHLHVGWAAGAPRHDLPVHLHRGHRQRAVHHGFDGRSIRLFDGPFAMGPAAMPVTVDPIPLPHDQLGSLAFVFGRGAARIGWATDLGRMPPDLPRRFAGVHVLAIESNYDPHLQATSDRPDFLKQRITGGSGHLSNEESARAARRVAEVAPVAHVLLLHLSQQCNCPRTARGTWEREVPELAGRVVITRQDQPAPPVTIGDRELSARPLGLMPDAGDGRDGAGGRRRRPRQGVLFDG